MMGLISELLDAARSALAWLLADGYEEATPSVLRSLGASNLRTDAASVAALCREHRITHVMNAVDPVFNMSIFAGAFEAGADYLDMAMSLSRPHPEAPYEKPGVKLGDEQFAVAGDWEDAGRLALLGIGVEPGLSDVFARYAADHLFSEIDELGTRDGANLVVTDDDGNEVFAPSFSIWTTIEECLNPPVIWEKERGWFTTEPFSEPEVFDFPEGIGPVECVHVEHEEVLLMPRWLDAKRVTFKYGLGEEFIEVLRTLRKLEITRKKKSLHAQERDAPRVRRKRRAFHRQATRRPRLGWRRHFAYWLSRAEPPCLNHLRPVNRRPPAPKRRPPNRFTRTYKC